MKSKLLSLFLIITTLLIVASSQEPETTSIAYAQQGIPSEPLAQEGQLFSEVETVSMPPVDVQALLAEDEQRVRDEPFRFAQPIAVQLNPTTSGTWETLDEGILLWRLRIISPEAVSLNLGFTTYFMPPGGRLYLYTPDYSTEVGPFTNQDNEEHGQLWTPILMGDDIVIEVTLPALMLSQLELELTSVNHGYRVFDKSDKSGSCNVDVVCPEGDDWRNEIRSVARYTLAGTWLCTGSLINNTAQDLAPYFLTADHCATSATPPLNWATSAPTMVFYWNYENSTCRLPGSAESGQPGDGSLSQSQSGATFRAAYADTDFALVELDDDPAVAFSVHWAGWDRTGVDVDSAVGIHHPNGEEKRITIENDPTTITSHSGTVIPGDGTHIRVEDWDIGTTEGGSSGSPLFNPDHRIIGQLHGGDAACGNDESDWYGRFFISWTGGGTDSTRLSNWLNPSSIGATILDGMDQLNILSPTDVNPAYAGPHSSPVKIIVHINKPEDGLVKNNFVITIGGSSANILTMYEGSEEYVLEVKPPNQGTNGLYDLTVSATISSETVSDAESDAVYYGDTNNVDVDLVIDRSGSMGTDKMNAAKDAAKQFVDFMQPGDMVGLVSFDDVVETNFPLTAIPAPSSEPPVFSDDMESGTGNWSTDAPWGLATASSHSPSHAWTDSPGGSYDNYLNTSLRIAAPINVPSTIATPVLSFWQRYELESGYDRGYVEVSTDGGSSWTSLANYTGTDLTWHKVELDLTAYKGQSLLVRFRLSTDSSVTRDGWYIDDVAVGQSTADTKALAKSAIDSLYSRSMTSIGGGLQRGQEQLSTRGNANHPWAIVLLSDGLENSAPYVADVLPTIKASKTVVHTVGLGSGADEALMLDIASQTGGTYNFAPTPEELSGIYNTISGAVADRQTLLATTGTAQQGVTDQIDVVVDSTVSDATFSVSWSDSSSTIDLTLRKPNGDIIDPAVAASDPNIEYVAGSTYKYYHIKTPTLLAGVWQMQITGGSVSATEGKGVIATTSGEPYVARVTAQASLTMRFYLGRDDYLTTEPVKLVVTLSDNQPILGATVNVTIQPPSQAALALRSSEWIEVNGDTVPDPSKVAEVKATLAQSLTSVTLYDDGTHDDGVANDGVYANTFGGSFNAGSYVFSASASGTSNTADTFARQSDISTYIAQNPSPPISEPGDCNDDDMVSAADLSACVLEIFDGDGSDPADTPGGSFAGNPGCDANEDGIVSAADLSCTVLIIFNGPGACGAGDRTAP